MIEIEASRSLAYHEYPMPAYGFKGIHDALSTRGDHQSYFLNYHYRSRSTQRASQIRQVTLHDGDGETGPCISWIPVWKVALGAASRGEFGNEPFMFTYGDGVSDININSLLEFHRLQEQARDDDGCAARQRVWRYQLRRQPRGHFAEKPQIGEGWINGGFLRGRTCSSRLHSGLRDAVGGCPLGGVGEKTISSLSTSIISGNAWTLCVT
jgi:glucose-1-phosphate cytidylyltransferase